MAIRDSRRANRSEDVRANRGTGSVSGDGWAENGAGSFGVWWLSGFIIDIENEYQLRRALSNRVK
jgi:hypothetical protein